MNISFGRVCRRLLDLRRPARGARPGRESRPSRRLQLEGLEARELLTGTWATLANLAPGGTGTMLLLSDGSVMAEGSGQSSSWFRLTPNAAGSYQAGTWSTLASMHFSRLYFGSNVLTDGRLFVVGGEYSSAGSDTNTGEIYNPLTNTWANIANYPKTQFGDDPTILLPDGRVLGGYIAGPQTFIYDPVTNTWTAGGTKLRNDQSDEESWVKLPDDSILSYDVFSSVSLGVGHAQRYIPATNTWVDTGTVPGPVLTSSAVGFEMGPAFLLPDGRVFQLGANGHTAFYAPATDTWAAGPDIPNGLGADDAPGALLPNGKVLFAADTPLFHGPTSVFEFDPAANTYTDVTPSLSGFSLSGASYFCRMLVLPTGQILMTSSGSRLALYTPDGAADPAWQPTISTINDNGNGTLTLTGTQLNGLSQGASYGDDAEMDSNYPIVRLTNDAGTAVYYARTFNWSSTGVATGSTPVTTLFKLPASIPAGHYNVQVVANGIASDPTGLQLQAPSLAPIPDQTMTPNQQVLNVSLSATGSPAPAFSATGQSLAYVLTQQTGTLTYVSSDDNFFGSNEKWLQAPSGQWYFILPTGALYQWDGSGQASGTLRGNVGTSYYADPTRLTNPLANQPHATFSFSGSTLTITRDLTWNSNMVVTVTAANALGSDSKTFNVSISATTGQAPVLSSIPDQTIPSLQQVVSVSLSATGTAPITFSATAQSLAYVLTQQTGTLTYFSIYDNYYGSNEKWLQAPSGQWYFILPTGALYQWDGSGQASGTLRGNVGTSYYADPTRLTNPPANQPHATLGITGNVLTITRDLTWHSSLVVTVTATNAYGSDSKTFNVFVTG
jgi:hypothetical protein